MDDEKVEKTFTINGDQADWLGRMAETYDLPDPDKALRIVLDYAMEDADADTVFQTIRCNHCG